MKKPEPAPTLPGLELLQARDFARDPPGTVLRDFDALLDFIGEGRVPLSPAYLLGMSQLELINQRLSKPVRMCLKRPIQKSYPPINGLYLLLRASGIGCVDTRQKVPALLADPGLMDAWRALNPVERYFELIKAWWARADEHLIGERGGLSGDFLLRSLWFLDDLLEAGTKRYSVPQEADRLRYHPGLYNLALMELFGFLELELMPPESGSVWLPSALRITDWGRALLVGYLAFCRKEMKTRGPDEEWGSMSALDPAWRFERWSRLVLPQVKDWRGGLDIPEPAFQPGPHVFKVFLGKRCWRRIAAPGNCLLSDFAAEILNAFNFDHDHLYCFSYQNRFGEALQIDHPYMEGEGQPADTVELGNLPLAEGMRIDFLFDFGDNWEFDIVVEAVNAGLSIQDPEVLEKRGEPPEQYGY
jgi:hypothetical protein